MIKSLIECSLVDALKNKANALTKLT